MEAVLSFHNVHKDKTDIKRILNALCGKSAKDRNVQ